MWRELALLATGLAGGYFYGRGIGDRTAPFTPAEAEALGEVAFVLTPNFDESVLKEGDLANILDEETRNGYLVSIADESVGAIHRSYQDPEAPWEGHVFKRGGDRGLLEFHSYDPWALENLARDMTSSYIFMNTEWDE